MKSEVRSGWLHFIGEIQDEVDQTYNGYHQYDWVRPRKTWLDARCPVYIDFGGECLVKLETYDDSGLQCIRYVSKRKFVSDAMIETCAADVAKAAIRPPPVALLQLEARTASRTVPG